MQMIAKRRRYERKVKRLRNERGKLVSTKDLINRMSQEKYEHDDDSPNVGTTRSLLNAISKEK